MSMLSDNRHFPSEPQNQPDGVEAAPLEGRAAESMADMLTTMSRELRTLLNGVLGMAQAMTADELAQAQRQRLKVVQSSGEALLALLNEPSDADEGQTPAGSMAAPAPGGLRLLAAEDNPTNQLLLKTLLGAAGIEPVVVSNGQEAVAAWKSGPWDMVLMDIQMPVMDGAAATRAIRDIERREGRMRTPIIALTANAVARHRAEYLAAGMDEVVAKPIHLGALLQAMERSLDLDDQPRIPAAG
jgi:CheY-like chemotaxis protein